MNCLSYFTQKCKLWLRHSKVNSFIFSIYKQIKLEWKLSCERVYFQHSFSHHKTVKQTLYCQKYSLIHPNNWNQVFQWLPWPWVYNSKHLGMQTVSTNNCERIGHSQELIEFQHGTAWYFMERVLMAKQLHPSHTSVILSHFLSLLWCCWCMV